MDGPRIFVSFSGEDAELARRLLGRLAAQPAAVWIYAREDEEIPGGANLEVRLRERIDSCDFFIPVVSEASLSAHWPRFELRHALDCRLHDRERVFPVVTADCPPPTDWPQPYSALAVIRCRMVRSDSRSAVEDVVLELCGDMQIDYVPPPTEDPRLPFMDRFDNEVTDRYAHRTERDYAVYVRLMHVRNDFLEAFESGDLASALKHITFFANLCEYELPQERFYYPYIVKAVCQILCGRLEEATRTVIPLRDHDDLDGNWFAALGCISHREGAYHEARDLYAAASRLNPSSAAAEAGWLMNAVLSGERVPNAKKVLRDIENGKLVVDEDRVKVRALKAFALANMGRSREAERLFRSLVAENQVNADILVNFADCLVRLGRRRHARDLLEAHYRRFPDANLLHWLASLTFQLCDFDRAAKHFAVLVREYAPVRQYWVDAAQAFWRNGLHAQARDLCARLLHGRIFPPPMAARDFFHDGFANWLLGNRERADYDFERSRMPPHKHYKRILEIISQ